MQFWHEHDCFRQSIELRKGCKEYNFYDGPPFATGLPHYGHILAGTIKDVIPRYFTMQGHYIPRKFGWDCHGVPVEHEMEKQLGLKSASDIDEYGVQNFCEDCRSIVLKYTSEWEETVTRMGRWVDFKNDYKTMDSSYMESIMWVFAELWKKGLIREGKKVVSYSPKLGSTLSNFEANLNYKDIHDPTVMAKFEIEPNVYVLAWTTTPWTLVSNVALGFGRDIEYVRIIAGFDSDNFKRGDHYIFAKDIFDGFHDPKYLHKFNNHPFYELLNSGVKPISDLNEKDTISHQFIDDHGRSSWTGKELVEKYQEQQYKPLFDYYVDTEEKRFVMIHDDGDYVTTDQGTGIVHFAPAFGAEDAELCKKWSIYGVDPINGDGYFTDRVPELNGVYFRADPEVEGSKENNANKWVIQQLKKKKSAL